MWDRIDAYPGSPGELAQAERELTRRKSRKCGLLFGFVVQRLHDLSRSRTLRPMSVPTLLCVIIIVSHYQHFHLSKRGLGIITEAVILSLGAH